MAANYKIAQFVFADSDKATLAMFLKGIKVKDSQNYREGIVAINNVIRENKAHEKFNLVSILASANAGMVCLNLITSMLDIPFAPADAVETTPTTPGHYKTAIVLNNDVIHAVTMPETPDDDTKSESDDDKKPDEEPSKDTGFTPAPVGETK